MRYSLALAIVTIIPAWTYALDGGTLRINARNGWSAFEVITVGDNPEGDGLDWSMPGTFDGVGAWLSDDNTLRLQVNHETGDAAISEVNLNLLDFKTAIKNVMDSGSTGGVSFVDSALQAYDRWSKDGGATWVDTYDTSNTSFFRFCSGQSYSPNTFGVGQGFVDEIYITGEEGGTNRLFAIDSVSRDFYQLSGVSGDSGGGLSVRSVVQRGAFSGMPFDAYENAALVDTGETDHIALLLSPDGGSQTMKIYLGEKGKDINGNPSEDFLARNGLAHGSYYYLNSSLPSSGTAPNGTFDTTREGALVSSKLEDVDTSPSDPTRVVLGDEDSGEFVFDFTLDFSTGIFGADNSSFSITKIQENVGGRNAFGNPDNVDWSAPTTLNGVNYPEGIIFTNEDNSDGEIWMSAPDGSGLLQIGDTTGISGATESSGILDISELVGYLPGSIVVTTNQGGDASLSVLVNPHAAAVLDCNGDGTVDAADLSCANVSGILSDLQGQLGIINGDLDGNGAVEFADFLALSASFGQSTNDYTKGDIDGDGSVAFADFLSLSANFGKTLEGAAAVPEPTACTLMLVGAIALGLRQRKN